MPRFFTRRFPPGFFDLPADAGETLPRDLIESWTRSEQTAEAADRLLGPLKCVGTSVSTDAAGLTRLSGERSLIEILSLINRPKELVHGYGTAIGGRSLGTWAADNTMMFYEDRIPAGRVMAMLLTLLDRVRAECEVGIGISAHTGVFYELGDGVYGADADRVEDLAEDHTEAGELVITDELARRLAPDHGFALVAPSDPIRGLGTAHRVADGPRASDLEATDLHYPLPYTEDFQTGLGIFARTRRESLVPAPAYRDVAVVVIERERDEPDLPEVAMLNDLALTAAVKRIGGLLLGAGGGLEIKTLGATGIYVLPDCRAAVTFAAAFRRALEEQGLQTRTGIDRGRVLVFELGPGIRDIAGGAVNVASKLSHDRGRFGAIRLSAAAAEEAGIVENATRLSVTVSGVQLAVCEM